MAATCKPKLPQLSTPVNSKFPISISGPSPLSAHPRSANDAFRTPISPPSAYIEYLHRWSLNSPMTSRPSHSGNTTPSTASSHSSCSCKAAASAAIAAAAGEAPPTSVPSSVSIKQEPGLHAPLTAPPIPPSPFTRVPMSAPANGASFPSLKVPPSPAPALSPYPTDSPMSARSPFSARPYSTKFDWDAALKARPTAGEIRKQPSRTSVRHIREVVTRTVTFTPRMKPAPKGKRRKAE